MYLTHCLILNSGPISDVEIKPEFNADGSPRPLVIVGGNGSGKTGVLSIVADGLIEIAAQHFNDIMPGEGATRSFFRIIGGGTRRMGSAFELSALKFQHAGIDFHYLCKGGEISAANLASRMLAFQPVANWQDGNQKLVVGPVGEIEKIFRSGAYVFFPSNRAETPHWIATVGANIESGAEFSAAFREKLGKPIVLARGMPALKPWLIDVLLDCSIDSFTIFNAQDLVALKREITPRVSNVWALRNINSIIQAITKNQAARLVRTGRFHRERKLQIFDDNKPLIPSLDGFSAGQATLFSMFSTIIMYGDHGQSAVPNAQIEGIVVIDELDSHLHADLQHDVLPALIKQFPRVQFIVSSHAPLFLLGMQKVFGDEGFTILEMPSCTKISAERFTEFGKSFEYFRVTKAFEEHVNDHVSKATKPMILCEGETDPIYLKTASELLGFARLINEVSIDWVGQKAIIGAQGGGKDNLNDALKTLKNNPQLLITQVVLLYDADANKNSEDYGLLHVRSLGTNLQNNICLAGIENMLPPEVFEDRFYRVSEKRTANVVTTRILNKKDLCEHLCVDVRAPSHFENFREVLLELERVLLPPLAS